VLGLQAQNHWLITILLALVNTFIIFSVLLLVIFILLHLLNQWTFFRRNKRIVTIMIYVVLTLTVFYMLFKQGYSTPTEPGTIITDEAVHPLFGGFYEIFIPGTRLLGLSKTFLWFSTLVILAIYARLQIIPNLFTANDQQQTKKKKQKNTNYSTAEWRIFLTYQLRQLQDTSFIMQLLFSKFYIPFVFDAPFLFGDN